MSNITVGRYPENSGTGYQGWIEPDDDRSWIAFVGDDGSPRFFLRRDPVTGAVL
jgi:hypothetical protein